MSPASNQTPALVVAAQNGDAMAMHDLLDHLAPYVGSICGPIALAEGPDAAQETLVAEFRHLGSLRDPAALHGWVRRIAVREAVRLARARERMRPASDLSELPAPGDVEQATDITDLLTRLAPEHRAMLILRDREGLSEAEAASLLDLPPGTVKSRLHRARKSFRREWEA